MVAGLSEVTSNEAQASVTAVKQVAMPLVLLELAAWVLFWVDSEKSKS
jgi:hypothetical protein